MSEGGKKWLCFFFVFFCQHRKWIPMWQHRESSDCQCWRFPLETVVRGIKRRGYKVPISEWLAQPTLPELLNWSRKTWCVFCTATGPRKGKEMHTGLEFGAELKETDVWWRGRHSLLNCCWPWERRGRTCSMSQESIGPSSHLDIGPNCTECLSEESCRDPKGKFSWFYVEIP